MPKPSREPELPARQEIRNRGNIASKEPPGAGHGSCRRHGSQDVPVVRCHGDRVDANTVRSQGHGKNTDNQEIEELARAEQKSALNTAIAELD